MATPGKIKALEEQHKTPAHVLIPFWVNTLGSQKAAAARLGLSQATVSQWLKDNGYVPRVVYIKGDSSHVSEYSSISSASHL